jgi:hypothetical protein
VTYETKVIDICRRQVFDLVQTEAPFCLCYGGQLVDSTYSTGYLLTDYRNDGKSRGTDLNVLGYHPSSLQKSSSDVRLTHVTRIIQSSISKV